MIIGIIAAMEPEIKHTISVLENSKKHIISNVVFHEGTINKHKVIVSLSGIGKVNSAINTTLLRLTSSADSATGVGIEILDSNDKIIVMMMKRFKLPMTDQMGF